MTLKSLHSQAVLPSLNPPMWLAMSPGLAIGSLGALSSNLIIRFRVCTLYNLTLNSLVHRPTDLSLCNLTAVSQSNALTLKQLVKSHFVSFHWS